MNIDLSEVKKQLSRLKCLLSLTTTDVCRSSYNSADEVIEELNLLEKGVKNQDAAAIKRLLFLLLPTCVLQEISISSGWGYDFLDIASSLEVALGKQI